MLSRSTVLLITISFLALAAGRLLLGQESHVRIVHVSYADGIVQLNNQNVTLNMPIIEGNVLTTGADSVAEVQFEDGSTMRLSPETQVSFAQLARLSSGEAITRVDLDLGEAEFTIARHSEGLFAVYAHKNILFKRAGRFRVLSTNSEPLELAVWKGEAVVHDSDTGTDVEVKANEIFTIAADDPHQYDLEEGIEADDLDRWSLQRDQDLAADYVSASRSSSSVSSPGFVSFGFADPCQPYYWASYWTLPGYCLSSNYFYPPPVYGFVYFPGHHRPHHHPHPPHIHPPTPPVAAAAVKTGPGSALVNARAANSAEHRPATRVLSDENFRRSNPAFDKREAKKHEREMKEAEREAKKAEREAKKAERETKKQGVLTTSDSHTHAHASSQDSRHTPHGDSGRSSQPQHASAISSRSTSSPRPSSSSSSGSHSFSGSSGSSHSSSGSSHASSSSHSSGSSSSGSSSHSSSGSSGGRGK